MADFKAPKIQNNRFSHYIVRYMTLKLLYNFKIPARF